MARRGAGALGLRAAVAGIALLLLTGGTDATPRPTAAAYDAMTADVALLPTGRYRWNDADPQAGPLGIWISIARQHIYVFRGGALIGVSTISTGMPGHSTPAGEFTILQKQQWHRSNLYSNAPMPFMQRLTWGGIALHAGPLPGRPASHGCIRLPTAFAKLLFAATRIGDRVLISGKGAGAPARAPVAPTSIAAAHQHDVPAPVPQTIVAPAIAVVPQGPAPEAVAYAPAPRLFVDRGVLKGSSIGEDDVAGGMHWGERLITRR